MLTPSMKSLINQLWDKFWSGGISNPLTAIEQISYLLFMRRLDEWTPSRRATRSLPATGMSLCLKANSRFRTPNEIVDKVDFALESLQADGRRRDASSYADENFSLYQTA